MKCRNGINEFREELRNESTLHYRTSSEGTEIDEQNGVVADLCRADNSLHSSCSRPFANEEDSSESSDSPNSMDMKLSLQLSMHMRRISSSFKRVNGVTDEDSANSEAKKSLRNSLDVMGINRLPSFNDFTECADDEADYNPWRDSIMEEDSNAFDSIIGSLDKNSSMDLDSVIVTHGTSEIEKETPASQSILHSPLKWNQTNLLFKKVFKLYDDIRNQRQYNVTSTNNECIVRFLNWIEM